MAVHLNASLETHKIPYLFSILLVVSLWSGHLHASADQPPATAETAYSADDAREDNHSSVNDEQHKELADGDQRRPGFSKITYGEDTIQSGASAAIIAPQLSGMDEVRTEAEGFSAESSPSKE